MNKSFIDLFEEQVEKTPGNIAVVFELQQLSFSELNEKSNQLAHQLRSFGVKEDVLVPLFIERGFNMVVGLLGIMKAGGAYVPIDIDFPQERISYMLQDSQASVLVCSKESRKKLPSVEGIASVEIDVLPDGPKNNLSEKTLPHHLAYVIYTSGSTGMPKGVMIEHRNLVDYITGLFEKTGINNCHSFALVSTIATDLGNTVIYSSLACGGTLHVFTKETVSNIEMLQQYFDEHKIECLKIVPSHWRALSPGVNLLLPGKLLIFGGEALPEKIIEDIRSSGSHCRVVNHYGPTETTIGKLLHIVEPDAKYEYTVPIGKPFSNTKVLVLTKNLKLCPIGVPGQLYITGDGVARGYWNNPELTKEKFIQNPFAKQGYSIMYDTGDLVKYLPDGNISFIGRADNQVKIRGYRIELGEIENVLQQSDLVSQAAILAKDDKQGNKTLVGYIISNGVFQREGILTFAKEKLPEYMVPAVLVEMDKFPLTANGKIDRNALPDTDEKDLHSNEFVAPRNEVEDRLAEIWKDVLEVDQVGIHDNFFELGGHSLLAVRLVSAIRKAFVVEMPISNIFDFPTVALLAVQLSQHSDDKVLNSIERVDPRPAHIPLSFSQERLWFIDRLEGSIQYHVPAVLRLSGNLNVEALNFALKTIVDRHEILRSVILDEDGHPYQQVNESGAWELSVVEGAHFREEKKALQDYIFQLIRKPFDLAGDYMIRATLIKTDVEEFLLIATLHHIASDGWSRSVLVKEVVELYNSFEEKRSAQLNSLSIQYADYAIWQRAHLTGEVFDSKINYWKDKLFNVAHINLPNDFKRPAVWNSRGAFVHHKVDKAVTESLNKLSQQKGVTLFMTLLAAFKVLLHRYSGQEDICVGTPIAGRQQVEVEELIGFFVNTLALRDEVKSNATFEELLLEVRKTTLDAYQHQEVPFEKIVDVLDVERDVSRNPVFQVMFVLRNTPEVPDLSFGNVKLSAVNAEHTTAMFDIQLFITETVDGLSIMTEYSTDLFLESTIRDMISQYRELLSSILKNPKETIGRLPILSKQEEHHLLHDLNKTSTDYPKDKTVVDLFGSQVLKTPDAIAVVFDESQYTYRELDTLSNQLAHSLKARGV
ncbi:MAG: amino acid adenylation domain-containing protein, partial [Ginsengibacter sp.]